MGKWSVPGCPAAVWRAVRPVLGAALAGTAAGAFERWWWIGDAAASFRPAFAVVLGAGALLAWSRRSVWWALGCGLIALISFFQLLPADRELPAAPAAESDAATVAVYCHNILGTSRRADLELAEVRAISPDIALFIEVDSWWAAQLQALEETYPYHLVEARDGFFGTAIYSRLPLRETAIRDFSGYELPSLLARFELDGRRVTLIGTHPPPPVNALSFRIRNWHFGELAREARLRGDPLIVAGDFNATPWSAAFRRFLREPGLRESAVSRQVTWSPVRCPWLLGLPIDYQLASEEWSVVRCQTGRFLGSDHRWTLVEFQLAPSRR